jgi:type II secretory pathway predicted ATPase ExeA
LSTSRSHGKSHLRCTSSITGSRASRSALTPDPEFIYLSKQHAIALAMLKYGLQNQAGFTLITGEVGSGKTTLIRHLLRTPGRQPHDRGDHEYAPQLR